MGKVLGRSMLPPGTAAPTPFIAKSISAVPIFSPSLRQESIFFLWQSQTRSDTGSPCSCTQASFSNLATTDLANYQSTPSFQNKLEESAACTELRMKERKPWHTDTYGLLFVICSRFKRRHNTDSDLKQS